MQWKVQRTDVRCQISEKIEEQRTGNAVERTDVRYQISEKD